MNLGSAIKGCRRQRRMSQDNLATQSGISAAYLSLLERGERTDPGFNTLQALANALKIPLSLLVFLGTDNTELAGMDQALVNKLKSATKSLMEAPHDSSSG